jgi:hypothetical protein
LELYNTHGPNVDVLSCSQQDGQTWIWDKTDGTIRSKQNGECLSVRQEIEVWAGPLSDGSQAVVLLNRADNGSEPITVKWSDIGFPVDHSAVVRDLWARKDIGTFIGNYTSPNIDNHAVMMLKITPSKSTTYHKSKLDSVF